MRSLWILSITLISLFGYSNFVTAAVCKVTDDHGVTKYQKCQTGNASNEQTIDLRYTKQSQETIAQNKSRLQSLKDHLRALQEERQFEKEQKQALAKDKKDHRVACEKSSLDLQEYMDNGYLFYDQKYGAEKTYLSVKEVVKRRIALYKAIMKSCGKRYIPDNAKHLKDH